MEGNVKNWYFWVCGRESMVVKLDEKGKVAMEAGPCTSLA